VLLTGKVKEATTRTVNGHRAYDAVVLDAPPTGRIGRFLNVTAETARLTRIGPIKTQSDGVAAILRSPVTSVHVVTLLEEMPVQETTDAVKELQRLGLPVGTIIVNATQPPLLTKGVTKGRVSQADVRKGLVDAGLPADKDVVAALVTEARAHLARREVEVALRAELQELGRPLIELPTLTGGVTSPGLYELAGVLLDGGRPRAAGTHAGTRTHNGAGRDAGTKTHDGGRT
jgi:anion-transporting  ArsA/GET3 family ATPase